MNTQTPQGDEPQPTASGGFRSDRAATVRERLAEIAGDLYCPECGYNLRALISHRCPECGYNIDIVRRHESQIPWTRRETIGSFKAYWATVRMVILRNQHFCLEISRPVDERHARRFRWMTVLYATLPVVFITGMWAIFASRSFSEFVAFGGYAYVGVIHLAILAFVLAITTVPYYALYHRDIDVEKQHRGAILTLYACAPLALMFLAALFFVGGLIATSFNTTTLDLLLYSLALGVALLLAAIMLIDVQRIIKRMLSTTSVVRRINSNLIGLWLAIGVLTLVGIPLAALFFGIVYYSLQ